MVVFGCSNLAFDPGGAMATTALSDECKAKCASDHTHKWGLLPRSKKVHVDKLQ